MTQDMLALAEALQQVYKSLGATRASGTPDMTPLYARNGLFGVCGMESTLVNAMVAPIGVETVIPFVPSTIDNPIYDALVHIETSTTAQASGCADCGKPSFAECAQTACFGRFCQQTQEVQWDRNNRVMNRGVPMVALNGDIRGPAGTVLVARGQPITDQFMLGVAGSGYNLRMDVGQTMWTGNPANSLGGRLEFPGFQILINTGKFDALTGALCPSLDSHLVDFGGAIIGAPGAPNIVTSIAALIRTIRYRIQGMNRNPDGADTRLIMRPEVWEQVAEAWACSYGLVCQRGGTRNERNDSLELARMRDRFLSSMSLPIDGREYPVVIDNLIPYTTSPYDSDIAQCSDIYVMTLSLDGERNIWGEFLDLNFAGGSLAAFFNANFGASPVAVTDGGRFAHAPTTYGGFCMDVRTITAPRLLVRMPQLCGRLQNVCAVPIGSYPDPTGSGFVYELDGGASAKPYLDLYGHCWPDSIPT